jgi:dynein heavy chain, axonemal
MVAKLKKHNIVVQEKGAEEPLQAIDNANTAFKEMVNDVFKVKSEIIPLQTKETEEIRKNLDKFSIEVQNYRQDFLNSLPFDYNDNMSNDEIQMKYKQIDKYYQETCKIEKKAQDYNNLEKLFELSRSQYKQLKECHNDLKNLKTMWDAIAMINFQYNDWKSKPWRQIKADTMSEVNKLLQNGLKLLSKEIKNYKGYNKIVDKVKNMGTVLPLVSALHSEFMEDRHWDQLK